MRSGGGGEGGGQLAACGFNTSVWHYFILLIVMCDVCLSKAAVFIGFEVFKKNEDNFAKL
jgi:hypothetical protein